MNVREQQKTPTAPEGDMILQAMEIGSRRALRIHKALGNPVATVRDGKVVWISPEEIPVEFPPESKE